MDFTREQIKQKFDTLPPATKRAIVDIEMEKITELLRDKYSLHIDQVGKLITEVDLVLVGLVPAGEFQKRIMKKVGLAEDVANLVTYDLNRELFAKIRASLREGGEQTNGGASEMSESKANGDGFEEKNESGINRDKEIGKESEEGEIMTPKPSADPTSKQMFDQKMGGLSGQAKQTVEVETKTGDNEETATPNKVRDPYREPI